MASLSDLDLGNVGGLAGDVLDLVQGLLGENGLAGNGNAVDTGLVKFDNGDDASAVSVGRDPDNGTLGATGAQVDHHAGQDGSDDLGSNLGVLSIDSGVDQSGGNQPGADVGVGTYDSGGALTVTGLSIGGDADPASGNPAGLGLTLAPDDDPHDVGFDIATSAASGDDRLTGLHVDFDTNTEDGALKDGGVVLAGIDDSDPDNGADLGLPGGTDNVDDGLVAVHLTDAEVPDGVVPDTGGLLDTGAIEDLTTSTAGPGLASLLDGLA